MIIDYPADRQLNELVLNLFTCFAGLIFSNILSYGLERQRRDLFQTKLELNNALMNSPYNFRKSSQYNGHPAFDSVATEVSIEMSDISTVSPDSSETTMEINIELEKVDSKSNIIRKSDNDFEKSMSNIRRSSSKKGIMSIKEYLNIVDEYNWPIFEFTIATNGKPLTQLMEHICITSGLLKRLNLSEMHFLNFIENIEKGYHKDLRFHNSQHATDVVHCIYYLSRLPKIRKVLNDEDLLALYIGAAIHDHDHPGNKFLQETNDSLAKRYNDRSVLENHHLSSSFAILDKKENNFFSSNQTQLYNDFRSSVIELVLATDLALHVPILQQFKSRGAQFNPLTINEDKNLLMRLLMKCSDVSNPTKNFETIYSKWINLIMKEFYRQGDLEQKYFGSVKSPFCDRKKSDEVGKCQKGFIEFIVFPLFESLKSFESNFNDKWLLSNRERFSVE
ncbi:High affinity cAMP-specific 3',5'-cyclic phosphodiesterase 7A [Lobulomyces angularis]|nr:High affinity cAMP-specific 3',5'-cyclic phosphodiesterase 7A [Lobulomyces angularis]